MSTPTPRATGIPFERDLDADETGSLPPAGQSSPARRPLRILHVEDSLISREVVRMILRREGHSVVCAEDGLVGVQILAVAAGNIDLVISDHEMPGVNGLEVVRYLRKIEFPGGILIHSGAFDDALIADYETLGVRNFLAKPTNAVTLIAAVEAATKTVR